MNKPAYLLAFGLLLGATHAAAVTSSHVAIGGARSFNPDGTPVGWTGDEQERYSLTDEPVATEASTAADSLDRFGYAARGRSYASSDTVETGLDLAFGETADPADKVTWSTAYSGAVFTKDWSPTQAGRFRITANYDIKVGSLAETAELTLGANVLQIENGRFDIYYEPLIIRLDASEDPDRRLTGTWTSDWIEFASVEQKRELDLRGETIGLVATVNTRLSYADSFLPATGQGETYAKLNFSYEVAPIPEPETYALFGIGLAGVALARRRKIAR